MRRKRGRPLSSPIWIRVKPKYERSLPVLFYACSVYINSYHAAAVILVSPRGVSLITHSQTHVRPHKRTNTHGRTRTQAHTHTHTHTHTHAPTHARTHARTHSHTHTHTASHLLPNGLFSLTRCDPAIARVLICTGMDEDVGLVVWVRLAFRHGARQRHVLASVVHVAVGPHAP